MASRKEYEMLFQLDAKLGSSYTSTFSKAKSGPSELQKEIRSLQSVQADISAYRAVVVGNDLCGCLTGDAGEFDFNAEVLVLDGNHCSGLP